MSFGAEEHFAAWSRASRQTGEAGHRYMVLPHSWGFVLGLEWFPAFPATTPDGEPTCAIGVRSEGLGDFACLLPVGHDGLHGWEEVLLAAEAAVEGGYEPELDGEDEFRLLDLTVAGFRERQGAGSAT